MKIYMILFEILRSYIVRLNVSVIVLSEVSVDNFLYKSFSSLVWENELLLQDIYLFLFKRAVPCMVETGHRNERNWLKS